MDILTEAIVEKLNRELPFTGFKLQFEERENYEGNIYGVANIILKDMSGLDSVILYISDEAYDWINNWIRRVFGKEYTSISWNNTRSLFHVYGPDPT